MREPGSKGVDHSDQQGPITNMVESLAFAGAVAGLRPHELEDILKNLDKPQMDALLDIFHVKLETEPTESE